MSAFGYGARRAIAEVVGGIVTSSIVIAFINSGLLDPSYTLLFHLLNVVGIVSLILTMPYWGTTYLIGWLFGLWIMSESGLVGILELLVYLGVPLVVLILRLLKVLEIG